MQQAWMWVKCILILVLAYGWLVALYDLALILFDPCPVRIEYVCISEDDVGQEG